MPDHRSWIAETMHPNNKLTSSFGSPYENFIQSLPCQLAIAKVPGVVKTEPNWDVYYSSNEEILLIARVNDQNMIKYSKTKGRLWMHPACLCNRMSILQCLSELRIDLDQLHSFFILCALDIKYLTYRRTIILFVRFLYSGVQGCQ